MNSIFHTQISPHLLMIISTLFGIMMASMVIVIRLKAAKRPTSMKRIILPPFFMSTGFLMFLFPIFRVDWFSALESFLVGTLFSIPLILTSRFEVMGTAVYLKRSKAFPFILIGLLLIRVTMKIIMGELISVEATAGLFFILAFGMILPWRVAMALMYQRLLKKHEAELTLEKAV
ncbi:CcdC family protein [Rubeoparvulum massiliense]|uniref:CcdC family protein n=1 Tax=Rubeoparvulum massiliense TaxID=1631346 RepID=UPI0009E4D9F6|nr:cytochrome c biogenesis protein CcdC [Rubeoparvulum massiliense]